MEFDKEISERLLSVIAKSKIKQSELIRKCEESGMPISQPDMSKICNGKKLSLYQAAALCKALDISVQYLITGKEETGDFLSICDSGKLISDPDNEAFQPYLGDMYLYFASTSDNEDKLIGGKMTVSREGNCCAAHLDLNTGARDSSNKPIIKSYRGRLLISNSLSGAYYILKSESLGEICTITLRHRIYIVKHMECRMGLCLTISAGENKVPTAHRILLSREKLEQDTLEKISFWLKTHGKNIRLEKNKYERLIQEYSRRLPECSDELAHILNTGNCKSYYTVSSEILRQQLSFDRNRFVEFLSEVYAQAEAEDNIKITENDDSKLYDLLQSLFAAKNSALGGSSGPLNL